MYHVGHDADGELDPSTMNMIMKPRCGNTDKQDRNTEKISSLNDVDHNGSQNKNSLLHQDKNVKSNEFASNHMEDLTHIKVNQFCS